MPDQPPKIAFVRPYRGRSAAREVGKALGFEIGSFERLSGLAPAWDWKDPQGHDGAAVPGGIRPASSGRLEVFELYRMAQDLPRRLGQHSGGMVICQGQLDSVPLAPATMPGRVVVQWDKDDCADMGIVKVDLGHSDHSHRELDRTQNRRTSQPGSIRR